MAVLTTAELKLWVYGGNILNVPTIPNYTLKKTKLSTENIIAFEIAELIKDYIEIKFNGDYNTIEQSKWVKWTVIRTYHDATTDTYSTDTYSQNAIAFRGYGKNTDGINPELSKDLLISNTVIHNKCGDSLAVPFYIADGVGVAKVQYFQDTSEIINSPLLGTANIFTVAQELRVNPPLDDIITIDKTASLTAGSDDSISTNVVPYNATEIQYTTHDGIVKTIPIECIEECGEPHHKVSFINKFGVMQDMWFFAKKTESMSSERKGYKRTSLSTLDSVSYDVSAHQNVYLENQGKEKFTMNTGFIHESYNEVIRQLLVSEYVYMHDRYKSNPVSGQGSLAIPIKIVSDNLDIKTRLHDKLINYELEFEADSDFIQSVR